MAAYAHFAAGYPSANQFSTAGGSTLLTLSTHPTAQSPLAPTTNASSLSPPSIGRDSSGSGSGATNSGTLTPDPATQTSITGSSSVVTGSSTDSGGSYPCLATASSTATPCCDNGRPIMTDPVTGQTVCSCQYDPARLALSSYTRIQSAAGVGVYGTPYPSNEQNPYPSIGIESGPFYSSLSNPYALKDSNNSSDVAAWTSAGLQPSAGYYTYDPTFGAYGYGASYDLASRRKNATRESTATLKAWLNEHKKNPYPTKGEKIMLAIITKMTLTQVSTWFANARRRLKKENKMTWEPKNRTEDDDDALASDEEKEREDTESEKRRSFGANTASSSIGAGASVAAAASATASVGGAVGSHNAGTGVGVISAQPKETFGLYQLNQQQTYQTYHIPSQEFKYEDHPDAFTVSSNGFAGAHLKDDERPKIWSLADTASEAKLSMPLALNAATRSEWALSYAQQYNNAPNQTSVVATISVQPTSPGTQAAVLYTHAVTPPQTPPNPQTASASPLIGAAGGGSIGIGASIGSRHHNLTYANADSNANDPTICYKDAYQMHSQPQPQYAHGLYYSANSNSPQQQFPQLQQQQQQQSARTALTQHAAGGSILQQHNHQLHPHPHSHPHHHQQLHLQQHLHTHRLHPQ